MSWMINDVCTCATLQTEDSAPHSVFHRIFRLRTYSRSSVDHDPITQLQDLTNCYHASIKSKPSNIDYRFEASSINSEVTILGWDGGAGEHILIGSDWELEDVSIMRLTCPEAGVFNIQSVDPRQCILYKIILHIKQLCVAKWLESFNNM